MKRNLIVLFVLCTLSTMATFSAGRNMQLEDLKLSAGQFDKCTICSIPVPAIKNMSIREKIGQMVQVNYGAILQDGDVYSYKIGSVYNDGGKWSKTKVKKLSTYWAKVIDNLQAKARRTRLKIPIIWGENAIHGYGSAYDATIFPHHIGLGSTRSPSLVKKISGAVAKELLAAGVRWSLSPSVNLCNNPLKDSCFEEFGSDPDLVSKMTIEIDGWQEKPTNKSNPVSNVLGDVLISSTAKVQLGNSSKNVSQSKQFQPLLKAIQRGVLSVWTDSSESSFVSDTLKGKLNFEGVVLFDMGNGSSSEKTFSNKVQSIVNAGIDVVRIGKDYGKFISTLCKLVNSGKVSEKRIDDAVERVLKLKKKLGLFQNGGCSYPSLLKQVGSPQHRALARSAVRKSLVLLKNDFRGSGEPLFPIKLGYTRILVTGSHANDIGLQSGGWTITSNGASGNITNGTTIFAGIEEVMAGKNGNVSPLLTQNPSGHEQADYVIVVVGEKPYSRPSSNPGSLHLDAKSEGILQTVCFSTPCVLVVISGRPLKIDHLLPMVDAVVAAWLPGSEGAGIADVLLGTDYDFGGKLSVPWFKDPKKVGSSANNTLFPYNYGLKKSGQVL